MLFNYELVTINAAENVFSLMQIIVSVFFYHILSNILKKIQSLGFQEHQHHSNINPEFAMNLRIIPALAFVQPVDVINTFDRFCDKLRL